MTKKTKVAFVSTNSITQGEQVGVLWNYLLKHNIKIHFAHRTFKWSNEARGQASVYCVIIGFGNYDIENKFIHDYETPKSEPQKIKANNINPYLIDTIDIVFENRTKPICSVPEMIFGSKPTDDGNLLFTDEEKIDFIKKEPGAKKFIKPFYSAKEFLNNDKRWCLWLESISPAELRQLKMVLERVENIKKFRLGSTKEATVKLANYPYLFAEIRQPKTDYILIPRHSSENRKYIPIAFLSKDNIVADSCIALPNASLYLFGIITSLMHNAWMRQVCGRLESRYRYSNKLVYNNFPFPENPTEKQKEKVEAAVNHMLTVREKYLNPTYHPPLQIRGGPRRGSSLADLYDPVAMPKDLTDAHKAIDDAVDVCYRKEKFITELNRLEFLFELYKRYTQPLIGTDKKKKTKINTTKVLY